MKLNTAKILVVLANCVALSTGSLQASDLLSSSPDIGAAHVNPGVVFRVTNDSPTIRYLRVKYFSGSSCTTAQLGATVINENLSFPTVQNMLFAMNKFSIGQAAVTSAGIGTIGSILSVAVNYHSKKTADLDDSSQHSDFSTTPSTCGYTASQSALVDNDSLFCCVNVTCTATGGNQCVETDTPTHDFTLSD